MSGVAGEGERARSGSNNLKDASKIVEEAQKLRANLIRDTSSFSENMQYS